MLGTGFDAMTGALLAVDLRGRDGLLAAREVGGRAALVRSASTIAGFPNLFTVTGPGSPSVLSNMMVSIEQHVDWIAGCIAHLREHGIATIEPSGEAEDAWVDHVREVGDASLYPRAKSWYMGANIPGKPRVLLPYVGGVGALSGDLRGRRRAAATTDSSCVAARPERPRYCGSSTKISQAMSCSTSTPLMNAFTLRPVASSTAARNLRLGGVLEQHADVAQALLLAHVEHAALDRRERVGEQADDRVRPGEIGMGGLGTAAELLLVEPYERTRDQRERAASVTACGTVARRLGGHRDVLTGHVALLRALHWSQSAEGGGHEAQLRKCWAQSSAQAGNRRAWRGRSKSIGRVTSLSPGHSTG